MEIAQAKHYISNKQELSDMECGICYELDPEMLRCKGSCKTVFCLHCITRSKSKNNSCPLRCSEVFELERIPDLKISFDCPYAKEQCEATINDATQFRAHIRTCKYISASMLEQVQKAGSFQCNNNHRLLFLNQQVFQKIYRSVNFYATTMNQSCSLCRNQTICTSICPQCSSEEKKVVFCIACRPLPCTKLMCPIGHLYFKTEVNSKSSVCDFCGVSISIFGKLSFRDTICNFDVCENCHNGLPGSHPLVPLSHHYYAENSNSEEEWASDSDRSGGQFAHQEDEGSSSNSEFSGQAEDDIDFDDPQQIILDFPQEQQQLSLQDQIDHQHNFESDYYEQE